MAIKIAFQNPQSGEIKLVKVGWSWLLLFCSGVFGIPLFRRQLTTWGLVFLAINVVALVCQITSANPAAQAMLIVVNLLALVLAIFMGIKGNEMTAKNYLARGCGLLNPTPR
jgi:hypothetical protein